MNSLLKFEQLDRLGGIRTFFTMHGWNCWNCAFPESRANYEMLAGVLGILPENMITVRFAHGCDIKVARRENAGDTVYRKVDEPGFDGIVTDQPRLLLCTTEADCVPVYLYDPVRKAIGMVHSGWKGTALRISENAVRTMHSVYGSSPSDIVAGIGPCICGSCYEVGPELRTSFSANFGERALRSFFSEGARNGAPGKYMLDLRSAVTLTLLDAGLKRENIFDSGLCTFHSRVSDLGLFTGSSAPETSGNPAVISPSAPLLSSQRRDGNARQRMLTGIMLI